MKLWKCISRVDRSNWKMRKLYSVDTPVKPCYTGNNASRNIIDAMGYADTSLVCSVECFGEFIEEDDQLVFEHMIIMDAWIWGNSDTASVERFIRKHMSRWFENEDIYTAYREKEAFVKNKLKCLTKKEIKL